MNRRTPAWYERRLAMRARILTFGAAVAFLIVVAVASAWGQADPCPTGMEPACAGQWSTPIDLWVSTPPQAACSSCPTQLPECACCNSPTSGPCREVAHTVLLHPVVLPGGAQQESILFWRVGPQRPEQAWVWAPGIGSVWTVEVFAPTAGPPGLGRCGVIFCGGHSRLPDGRIVVVDGTMTCTLQLSAPARCPPDAFNDYSCADNGPRGTREAWLFDPGQLAGLPISGNPWTRLNDLNERRWYPGVMTMANGDILVAGGQVAGAFCTGIPCTQPGGPVQGTPLWADSSEVLSWNGGAFNPLTTQWQFSPLVNPGLPAPDSFGLYSHLFLLRNPSTSADVFVASHDEPPYSPANPANWAWVYSRTNANDTAASDSPLFERSDGTAVAVPGFVDRFALVGGKRVQGPPPFDYYFGMSDVEDISSPQQAGATWFSSLSSTYGDLNQRRLLNHTVILPDGTLLTVGGMDQEYRWAAGLPFVPLYHAELLDPSVPGAQWRLMAQAAHRRPYHAGAILLADGRVLVTGGEFYNPSSGNSTTGYVLFPNLFESDAEIYSPPYLFKGPRPSLLSSPTNPIAYTTPGNPPSTFQVEVMWPVGTAVDRFVLMRPGSATHGVNFEQNYVPLAFQPIGPIAMRDGWYSQAFQLTAPAHDLGFPGVSHEAPPGYYMLFVVISQGGPYAGRIPSVARFVRLL